MLFPGSRCRVVGPDPGRGRLFYEAEVVGPCMMMVAGEGVVSVVCFVDRR